MADLPGGNPPRIVGPVSGPSPISPTGGGGRRDTGQDQRQDPPGGGGASPQAAAAPADAGPPPTPDPLVQALDRLRATQELRPVDAELIRLLRGRRQYAGDTPAMGNPALPDDGPAAG